MQAIITVLQDGRERRISAETGEMLSSVFGGGHIHLDMPCGGKGICRRCEVRVAGETRLACQTVIDGDMRVELTGSGVSEHILAGSEETSPPVSPMYARYGIAVDIGTTTLCLGLYGIDGKIGATVRKNPQRVFGADVISRIEIALDGHGGELSASVRRAVAEMTGELAGAANIGAKEIDAAVLTGNTTMLYLLTGQNPESLSRAPFDADRLFGETLDASAFDLGISPSAKIYLPRCISAFVGGDITTAILASGMCDSDKTALLTDIGTNGELALWHNGKLSCCSTAAGPAFEGVGIERGVYGIPGAIDKVWLDNGEIRCSTIGGEAAVGICGSGVTDALAVMLALGIIDETGAFADESDYFELTNGVGITASDVRKLQLAKGSVRAGIETLLTVSGVAKSQIDTLYIAGGFGNYLNLESAAAIGLIPPELLSKAVAVGNAAYTGAAMLLQNTQLIPQSETCAKNADTVRLDANPVFTDNYMRYMMF